MKGLKFELCIQGITLCQTASKVQYKFQCSTGLKLFKIAVATHSNVVNNMVWE